VTVPRSGGARAIDDAAELDELAWNRSALALAALGAVLLKRLSSDLRVHPGEAVVLFVMAIALGVMGMGYERHRRRHERTSRLALKMLAGATAVLGMAAFVIAIVATS
jgi:uncharacterized membrane protein YidH (DUF202 family)